MNFKLITERLWNRTPAKNWEWVKAKLDMRQSSDRNDLLDPLFALNVFPTILAWCLNNLPEDDIYLFGDAHLINSWGLEHLITGKRIHVKDWCWEDIPASGRIVICRPPYTETHWNIISKANATTGKLTTIGELVAPFLQISVLMGQFDYLLKSMDEVIPIFLGQKFFGPIKEVNAVFPLAGKSVIEFGCFDGYQTLGLCHVGAQLTCVEARADNIVKTRAALSAIGFDARIIMDDFHNVHPNKYGRFDLAFAHGVYYHSVAPFVFFENLIGLSDHIFIGGYCATDNLPVVPWEELTYEGKTYRAKTYRETVGFTAGLNHHAWFFHKDDLKQFFAERDFEITEISDDPSHETAGNFTRFFAKKI